jgi:hypothetical protein
MSLMQTWNIYIYFDLCGFVSQLLCKNHTWDTRQLAIDAHYYHAINITLPLVRMLLAPGQQKGCSFGDS